MNGYPSAPDLRTSSRPVTPDKSSIHSNQNILDPVAISPSFFDQEACPSQDADLDTSDMDFMSDLMTAVDAAIEAGVLNAIGDGTSFSNDNLGLEGFDAAFSSASVTNTGFPSGQPASQIFSPFVDRLDIHQLSGYPPEDITLVAGRTASEPFCLRSRKRFPFISDTNCYRCRSGAAIDGVSLYKSVAKSILF